MKILNKFILSAFLISLSTSIINAQTTVCYKNNWDTPSTIERTPLDGDVCEGKYSLKDMQAQGWNVVDIKVDSKQNKLNYRYFLVNSGIQNKNTSNNNETSKNTKGFSIRPIGVKIKSIENNTTTIDVGNLTVGQSGIVVHIYDNDRRLIVSNAKVIQSNVSSSIVEFFPFNDLKQDAIPTSKKQAAVNDILVLNYMYPASLLIAPTQETFQIVRNNFKYNNFLHSDIFAAQLKYDSQPYPSKNEIQKFAIEQNLGTVFIVVNQKIYILDSKTFKILSKYDISYEEKDFTMPFYSRVEDIKESLLSFNLSIPYISEQKPKTYKQFYNNILGIE